MALIPTIPGLEVREARDAQELLAARRLHADCYVAEGYVDESELDSGLINDPWVPFSTHVVAIDTESDEIAGTARIIRPSVRGFPAVEHFELLDTALEVFADLDPNRCTEISALATRRQGIQNIAISAAIYSHVWRDAVVNQRAYMLAILDDRLLRILRRWFQLPFEVIGHPREFMGARTMPTAMYLPRALSEVLEVDPEQVEWFKGELSFAELEELTIDIRDNVPDLRPKVVDLSVERAVQQ